MVNNEPLVTEDDLKQVRLDIGSKDFSEQFACLFEREPKLAEMMGENWHRLNELFGVLGLNLSQKEALTKQITLLAAKPLIVLDRAHRRQWDDVLPMDGGDHA